MSTVQYSITTSTSQSHDMPPKPNLSHLTYLSSPHPSRLLPPSSPFTPALTLPATCLSRPSPSLGTFSPLPPELFTLILTHLPLTTLLPLLRLNSTFFTLISTHPTLRLLLTHTPTLLHHLLATNTAPLHPLSKLALALCDPSCRLCQKRYRQYPDSRTTERPMRFFAAGFDLAQGVRVCVECADVVAGLGGGVVTGGQAAVYFGVREEEVGDLMKLKARAEWCEGERGAYGLDGGEERDAEGGGGEVVEFYRVRDIRRFGLRKYGSRRRWEREKARRFVKELREPGEKTEVAFQRWEGEYLRRCCEGVGVMTVQAGLFVVDLPVVDRTVLMMMEEEEGDVEGEVVFGGRRHTKGYGCKGCFATRFVRGIWPRFARSVVYREGLFTHHEMLKHIQTCEFVRRLERCVKEHPRKEFWREFVYMTGDPLKVLRSGGFKAYVEPDFLEEMEGEEAVDGEGEQAMEEVGSGFWSDSED